MCHNTYSGEGKIGGTGISQFSCMYMKCLLEEREKKNKKKNVLVMSSDISMRVIGKHGNLAFGHCTINCWLLGYQSSYTRILEMSKLLNPVQKKEKLEGSVCCGLVHCRHWRLKPISYPFSFLKSTRYRRHLEKKEYLECAVLQVCILVGKEVWAPAVLFY